MAWTSRTKGWRSWWDSTEPYNSQTPRGKYRSHFARSEPILVPRAAYLSDPVGPWHEEMVVETQELTGYILGLRYHCWFLSQKYQTKNMTHLMLQFTDFCGSLQRHKDIEQQRWLSEINNDTRKDVAMVQSIDSCPLLVWIPVSDEGF